MVWLKYRAKRERGRWSREVSKKEAGVVDPRQAENSSVFLGQEFGLPSGICKQGNDMLRCAF